MTTTVNAQVLAPTSGRSAAAVWKVAGIASAAGVAVAGAYEAVVRAAGVPMDLAMAGADHAEPIPEGGFAGFTVMWAVAGFVLALALARWAKRPGRTYAVTAWTIVVLSLAMPFATSHTALSTRIALTVSHVVVALAVVPVVTARLARITR